MARVRQRQINLTTPALSAAYATNASSATISSTVASGTRIPFSAAPVYRGALVYSSGIQNLTNNVETALIFANESYDTDNIHDNVTNNTRLTVPAAASKIKLSCYFGFSGHPAGWRVIGIKKNGTGSAYPGVPTSQATGPIDGVPSIYMQLQSAVIPVVSGDYFEVLAYQNSGTNLDSSIVPAWFAMEIIE